MTILASCPDQAALQRFTLGQMTDAEIEACEQHLQKCGRCLATLALTAPPDALADVVRAAVPLPPENPAVEELIERLQQHPPHLYADTASEPPVTHCDPSKAADPSSLAVDDTSAIARRLTFDFLAPPERADEIGRLGPFRVLAVLGMGGMGIVFRAESLELRRVVALKVLQPTMAANPSIRQRFVREGQAAAAIEHEHVVTIYRVGEDRDVPYLAMQLLMGESLADRLQREPRLPRAEILRIGREIALGLAAAHESGLIHRDIKPANLWLEGEQGRVKILDFGLARAARNSTPLTHSGLLIGTPAYMAPEQARSRHVDHRADLFSLGCVLYRCCCGRPPFQGADTLSILAALALDEPPSPRQLNADVPPAFSKLIMQLLCKDPAGRPASARSVVEMLAALEIDGPTAADRVLRETQPRSLSRWRGRRSGLAIVVLLVLLAPLAYLCASLLLRTLEDKGPSDRESVDAAAQVDTAARKSKRAEPVEEAAVRCFTSGQGIWKGNPEQGDGIEPVAVSPDGHWLFSGGRDGILRQWNVATGEQQKQWKLGLIVSHLSLAPGARRLLVGVLDRKWVGFILFDFGTGEEVRRFRGGATWPTDAAFSPDGRRLLVSGHGNALVFWDVATGVQLNRKIVAPYWITRMAVSRDFHWALTFNQWHYIAHLWDVASGTHKRTLAGHRDGIMVVAISPDGRRALTGSKDKTVRLWDLKSVEELQCFRGHTETVTSVVFSADGRRVLSGGADHTVRLWDADSGEQIRCFTGHTAKVTSVLFTPDGRHAVSASADKSVRLWRLSEE